VNFGDVHPAGHEPLLRDRGDGDDSRGEQYEAGRLHGVWEGPLSANPTNAAIAVPTPSIGLDPEVTSLLYASRARFSR
jgi:hypothetical protein